MESSQSHGQSPTSKERPTEFFTKRIKKAVRFVMILNIIKIYVKQLPIGTHSVMKREILEVAGIRGEGGPS